MSARASWRVRMGLGGSYRAAVLASAPVSYWPMDEYRGTVADDKGSGAHDGAYVNAPILGFVGAAPEGGTAPLFIATQSMDVPDTADHRTANLSLEFLLYPTQTGVDRPIYIKANNTLSNGYGVFYSSSNVLVFYVGSLATFVASTVTLSTWTHFLCTYDGTNMRLYKNGALVAGPTAGPGAITHSSTTLRIATHASIASSLLGLVAHVAYYNSVLTLADAAAHYAAVSWSDVSADLDGDVGISGSRGIMGFTPADRLARPGLAQFAMKNHRLNSGGVASYYSPGHASCRSGFTYGVPVWITASYAGQEYSVFRGKVDGILPEPGQFRQSKTWCDAHDALQQFAEQSVREVSLQVNQTEDQLLFELLESLPFDARPVGVNIAAGVDTYPYAFHNVGPQRNVLDVMDDLLVSAQGLGVINGDGTFTYSSRTSLEGLTAAAAFTNNDFLGTDEGLTVASDLSNVFNRVRIKIHPITVDPSTVVLYSHPGLVTVAPGETVEVWGDYHNLSRPEVLCGGFDMQPGSGTQTLATPTDYLANSAANGSGSNISSSVVVVATFFGSSVKFVITNNHATLTANLGTGTNLLLQCRGKGVYDLGAPNVESFDEMPYGDRRLDLDFVNQGDGNVAQDLADSLKMQLKGLAKQPRSFALNPQRNGTLMASSLILAQTLGVPLSLSEERTGLAESDVFVRSVNWRVGQNGTFNKFQMSFGVTPRTSADVWQLDVDHLDTETVLGVG